MSRAEEINRLVNEIVSRPLITRVEGIDGMSVRKEITLSTTVNKFLQLCRLWNKYQEKRDSKEKIDISEHEKWARCELKGYRETNISEQSQLFKKLCSHRDTKIGFVKYSISELELGYTNDKPLFMSGDEKLPVSQMLPIIHSTYIEIVDIATDLGKEIDIKHDYGMPNAYGDLELGGDYTEYDQDNMGDPTGGAFLKGDED